MQAPSAVERFETLDQKEPLGEYNYDHFRTVHLARDGKRTLTNRGILPGELAPDFQLPQAGGGSLRLSDLRGTPMILHFGSYS